MDTLRSLRIRRAGLLIAAMTVMLISAFQAPARAADPKERIPDVVAPNTTPAPASISGSAKMVGRETCATCHADTVSNFDKTFHGRKALSNAKLSNSCESCHGAGSGHVDGGGDISLIVNPKKLDAAAASGLCLSCHKDAALMMWKTGSHATNDVSCLTCHSVHEGEGRKNLTKSSTDSCLQCHKKQKAEMRLSSHHPVPEGKMSCVSCHNPHGGIEGNLKADSRQETCIKCHGDKAGPFAYEHPPVSDDCMNCHKPHGSSTERLLKQNMPNLCLSCHRLPHAATRSGAAGQQGLSALVIQQRGRCYDCHNQIHGSDRKPGLKD